MSKTQNSRDLITELARTYDLEPKMLEQKVFSVWREYLGTPLGTRTMPVSISGGVLKVYTEYPLFKQELLLGKETIIANLNAELGQPILTDLRIDVRPSLKSTPDHTAGTSTRAKRSKTIRKVSPVSTTQVLTPETLEQIEQVVTDITDTDLKTSLCQLFISQSRDKS